VSINHSNLQSGDIASRKSYSAPSLIEYGSLGDITLTRGTKTQDNTGNDAKNKTR
jgi:hypothetical protein